MNVRLDRSVKRAGDAVLEGVRLHALANSSRALGSA